MDCLAQARDIYRWLSGLQVRDDLIEARREKDRLRFGFLHPSEGEIEAESPLPEGEVLYCRGIALRVEGRQRSRFRLSARDHGGIFDPVDRVVPSNQYAATHFALLGAILCNREEDAAPLDALLAAMRFHLRRRQEGEGPFPCDLNNFALAEAYGIIGSLLPEPEAAEWVEGMRNWREDTDHPSTSGKALRAYVSLLRLHHCPRMFDGWNYRRRMHDVRRARQRDGCFVDARNRSRSLHRHAFTLAILHRVFRASADPRVLKDFLSGVRYLSSFVDPDGCFNYIGEGKEHLTGYAAAVYVFEAARLLDGANREMYASLRDRLLGYVRSFQREDGHFPLVLNRRLDDERFGWSGDDHLTAHNAFAGVWLALAGRLEEEAADRASSEAVTAGEFVTFSSTGQAVLRKGRCFAVFQEGLASSPSEHGITPQHLWFEDVGYVFTCPGVTDPASPWEGIRREDEGKNVFAPLVLSGEGGWNGPAGRASRMNTDRARGITQCMMYGPFHLTRSVTMEEDALVLRDVFRFVRNESLRELRVMQLPVVIDKFKIDLGRSRQIRLYTGKHTVLIRVSETEFPVDYFEPMETVRTPKGYAQIVGLRIPDFQAQRNRERSLVCRVHCI